MNCTGIVHDDREWNHKRPDLMFCRCPVCKGFLPQYLPDDKPFICKKCGAELMIFPIDHDKDDEHWDWEEKICPISLPAHKGEM